jgi:acyl-CoA thioesterase-1
MSPNEQTKNACLRRAAVTTALFAAHAAALHAPAAAQAQAPMPPLVQAQIAGHFVAPRFAIETAPETAPIAAPSVAPVAVSVMAAASSPRPPASDMVKPDAQPQAAAATAASVPQLNCSAPGEYTHFAQPLAHTMRRLADGAPLTIVAIGSSSTAGAGATSSAANYPSQLAADLRQQFPDHVITVINRGVNGEETSQMVARFAADVVAQHPQLVIWQVGTNSVLRDRPLQAHSTLLHEGVEQLKALNTDVVLMDPQYAPAVVAKSEIDDMVAQIAVTAKAENVDLFQRFAIMRSWHEVQHLAFDTFVSPDHVHMNDWSYACVAKLLAAAITDATTRPIASAAINPAVLAAPAKPAGQ